MKRRLRAELGEDVFASWFAWLELQEVSGGVARLTVPARKRVDRDRRVPVADVRKIGRVVDRGRDVEGLTGAHSTILGGTPGALLLCDEHRRPRAAAPSGALAHDEGRREGGARAGGAPCW